MKAEGKYSLSELPVDINKLEPLSADKVSYGEVYVERYLSLIEGFSLSALILAPNSAVKYHIHQEDNELYDNFFSNVTEVCTKGNGHELVNTSIEKWLIVISKKWK